MYYFYNAETELYYAVTSVIEEGTGLVTLTISQTGIPSDPGYVPAEGEILCPIEYYLSLFKISPTGFDGNRYVQIAQSVSRYVERYCNTNWTEVTVPSDLLYTVACMIRDRYNEADKNKDPRFKSESVKSYSYTISDKSLDKSILSKYSEELDMFRHIPFC